MAGATRKPKQKQEKLPAAAFVNWKVGNIKSKTGFVIDDAKSKYTSPAEQALVALAKKHGGSVRVMAELRIVINEVQPSEYSIDDIAILE